MFPVGIEHTFAGMEEKDLEILKEAQDLFMRYGIKSLTMDDIARHLRISKKTLYKIVKDKDDLVTKSLAQEQTCHMEEIDEISSKDFNAIDEMIEVSKRVTRRFKNIHPSIFYDLEKYHPRAWGEFVDFKMKYIYQCLHANVERGKEEGLYRKDVNPDIAARLWLSRIDELMDPDRYPSDRYKFHELYVEMLRHHIRGIGTEKGIEYLKKRVKEEGIDDI